MLFALLCLSSPDHKLLMSTTEIYFISVFSRCAHKYFIKLSWLGCILSPLEITNLYTNSFNWELSQHEIKRAFTLRNDQVMISRKLTTTCYFYILVFSSCMALIKIMILNNWNVHQLRTDSIYNEFVDIKENGADGSVCTDVE